MTHEEIQDKVLSLRCRLDRAVARGQVELHMDVLEVALLLTMAEAFLDAVREAKEQPK